MRRESFEESEEASSELCKLSISPDIFGTNAVDKILNSEASNQVTLFQFCTYAAKLKEIGDIVVGISY